MNFVPVKETLLFSASDGDSCVTSLILLLRGQSSKNVSAGPGAGGYLSS